MSILGRLLRRAGAEQSAEAVASNIVDGYRVRSTRGDLRVDDWLLLELSHVLPEKTAQDVLERFRTRRARSDSKAEYLLVMDIGVGMHDADHYERTL